MTAPNDPPSGLVVPASISEPAGAAAAGDPLAEVLASVRLTGALFFVVDATSPWCIDVPETRSYARIILPRDQHVLSYHVIVEGQGWARVPGEAPVPLRSGDIVVFPHGDPYVMESAPGAPPELDRDGTLAFFRALADGRLPFVVTEGGGAMPKAQVICGFLGCEARRFNPVLASLPRLLRLRRDEGAPGDLLDRLIALTMEEARSGRSGGGSVKLRLSELMFIELLRRYAAAPGPKPAGWLAGLQDARIARALAALHASPARDWTVADLARAAGLSRSGLAERFARLVGQPPARYLALWRMQLAAGLLANENLPVAEVAARVGYASEAAFSRSFKRLAGRSPNAWRRGARD